MRHPASRWLAVCAAFLAIAVVWMVRPGRQSSAAAFNQVADAIMAAKSARFQMEVAIGDQPPQKFQAYYLAPGKYRQEISNFGIAITNIIDTPAGKYVILNPAEKTATVMNMKGAPKDQASLMDQFERLQDLLSKNRDAKIEKFERIGEKDIDGRKSIGFRLDSPAATITMWGDSKSGYPVRIESVLSGVPRTEVAMTNFEINVELDKALFDATPPAGYKVQSFDVDASKGTEQDLIQAFKLSCEIAEGEFIEGIDMASIQKLIFKNMASRGIKPGDKPTEEEMAELLKQATAIGRGFQFAMDLPESAEAHYAGKGIKKDDKEKPVFWYKPEGAKNYRVIYADLSIKDADAAPQVPGARKLEKTSKSAAPAQN